MTFCSDTFQAQNPYLGISLRYFLVFKTKYLYFAQSSHTIEVFCIPTTKEKKKIEKKVIKFILPPVEV